MCREAHLSSGGWWPRGTFRCPTQGVCAVPRGSPGEAVQGARWSGGTWLLPPAPRLPISAVVLHGHGGPPWATGPYAAASAVRCRPGYLPTPKRCPSDGLGPGACVAAFSSCGRRRAAAGPCGGAWAGRGAYSARHRTGGNGGTQPVGVRPPWSDRDGGPWRPAAPVPGAAGWCRGPGAGLPGSRLPTAPAGGCRSASVPAVPHSALCRKATGGPLVGRVRRRTSCHAGRRTRRGTG